MELSLAIKTGMSLVGISTYEELSKLSGVPINTIKKYATSRTGQYPSISNLNKLSKVINLNDYLLASIDNFSIQQNYTNQKLENNCEVNVPFYRDYVASAGFGAINHDTDTEVEQITLPISFLRATCGLTDFKNLSIITCSGNSMSPTLCNGDFLIVQQDIKIKDRSIYIIDYDGEIYVKRVQKHPHIRLISDNKEYLPIEIKDQEEIRIIARVVGSFKGINSLLNDL